VDAIANDHDRHAEYRGRVSPSASRRPEPIIGSDRSSHQHVSPIARFLSAYTTEGASANTTRPPSSAGETTKFSTSENDSAISLSMQSPRLDFASGGGMGQGFDWSGLQQTSFSLAPRPAVSRVNTSRSNTSNRVSDDEHGPLQGASPLDMLLMMFPNPS
jgi:hypothetical protein